MLGPKYGDPRLVADVTLEPGIVVEHRDLPGVGLNIISGPTQGVTGQVYRVLLPGGRVEKVKKVNLIL